MSTLFKRLLVTITAVSSLFLLSLVTWGGPAKTPSLRPERTALASQGKSVTITGCLKQGDEAGEFAITGADGKTVELTSTKVALKEHVGHKVTVTGVPKKEDNDEDEDEQKGGGLLEVTSLKMISKTCG